MNRCQIMMFICGLVLVFNKKLDTNSMKNGYFFPQLGMIKCSEIRLFSMKFPSEGEFWHCHFAGNKLGA